MVFGLWRSHWLKTEAVPPLRMAAAEWFYGIIGGSIESENFTVRRRVPDYTRNPTGSINVPFVESCLWPEAALIYQNQENRPFPESGITGVRCPAMNRLVVVVRILRY